MVKWNTILYTLVNITGLQFFGRNDPAVDEFFEENQFAIQAPLKPDEYSLRVGEQVLRSKNKEEFSFSFVKASAALIYDAVYFFARALKQFVDKHPFQIVPLKCEDQRVWQHGAAFALFLKKVFLKNKILFSSIEPQIFSFFLFQFEANGITGKIKFDENGLRTDVTLEVVDLAAHGVHKV